MHTTALNLTKRILFLTFGIHFFVKWHHPNADGLREACVEIEDDHFTPIFDRKGVAMSEGRLLNISDLPAYIRENIAKGIRYREVTTSAKEEQVRIARITDIIMGQRDSI